MPNLQKCFLHGQNQICLLDFLLAPLKCLNGSERHFPDAQLTSRITFPTKSTVQVGLQSIHEDAIFATSCQQTTQVFYDDRNLAAY